MRASAIASIVRRSPFPRAPSLDPLRAYHEGRDIFFDEPARRSPPRLSPPLRALLLATSLLAAPLASSAAELSASASLSTDGVYQLQWSGDVPVEIEEATDAGFGDARLLYRGTDTAAVVTGRTTGTYHYRLVDAGGAQAGPLLVRVEHHPLSRALAFFGVGAVVFVATVFVVVRGARESRSDG